MAIKYSKEVLKNNITGANSRYCAVAVNKTSSDDIAKRIEKETGIPQIEVMTVLRTFFWQTSTALLNSEKVIIDDFGVFQSLVSGDSKGNPTVRINFAAMGLLKKCLNNADLEDVTK